MKYGLIVYLMMMLFSGIGAVWYLDNKIVPLTQNLGVFGWFMELFYVMGVFGMILYVGIVNMEDENK